MAQNGISNMDTTQKSLSSTTGGGKTSVLKRLDQIAGTLDDHASVLETHTLSLAKSEEKSGDDLKQLEISMKEHIAEVLMGAVM